MIITDINGENVKIGKSSITVKDNNGKTKGVVTNCKAFSAMSPADKQCNCSLSLRRTITHDNTLSRHRTRLYNQP